METNRIEEKQLRLLFSEINRIGDYVYGKSDSEVIKDFCSRFNVVSLSDLTDENFEDIMCEMNELLNEQNSKYAC